MRKHNIMKKMLKNQKNRVLFTVLSIIVCETLLNFDNMILQSLGMVVVPFTVLFGFLLMKNSEKGIE